MIMRRLGLRSEGPGRRTAWVPAALAAAAIAATVWPVSLTAQEARPFGGFRHDSSEPIEVTSDSLEVREAESIAIFSGSVIAGQGTLRLNADRVTVLFAQEAGGGDADTGRIRNMQAEGDVFLTNGTETAEGRTAEYDVASGMMYLRGDVVLTQGQNVIAGEVLEIDLNTGRANMVGQTTAAAAPAAQGAGGRVRMRLVPASREGESGN